MLSNSFTRSTAKPCLFMEKETNGSPIVLVLYVEDMLIARKHETTLQELKCNLKLHFPWKKLQKLSTILDKNQMEQTKELTTCVPGEVQRKGIGKISDEWCKAISSASSTTSTALISTCPKDKEETRLSFKYLKGIKEKWICYGKGNLNLRDYCESDMAGDVGTRKSTQGNIYTLTGELFRGVHSCNELLHSPLQTPSISQLPSILRRPFG